jgi:hypothetical protein
MAKTTKVSKTKEEQILEKLGTLHDDATVIENDMNKLARTSADIQKMYDYEDELAEIRSEMSNIVENNKDTLTGWKPDKFSKGKKDIIAFGTNAILRSKTTRRKIIPVEFVKKYPLEANVMIEEGKITIPIGVVEAELGKNKVNEICTSETTFSYKYESRKIPESLVDPVPTPEPTPKQKRKATKAKSTVAAK